MKCVIMEKWATQKRKHFLYYQQKPPAQLGELRRQSLVAGLFIFLIFFVLSEPIGVIVLASIGSTFFTVFALPNNRTAKPRNVIGSHVVCILIGLACCPIASVSLGAGIAVGASAFFMVITDTEHPPAAGIALGLALASSPALAFSSAGFALVAALLASA